MAWPDGTCRCPTTVASPPRWLLRNDEDEGGGAMRAAWRAADGGTAGGGLMGALPAGRHAHAARGERPGPALRPAAGRHWRRLRREGGATRGRREQRRRRALRR